MKYYVVDAFTYNQTGGNKAAIIFDNNLSSECKQSIAKELNFSETAFVDCQENNFTLSYYTPLEEVDLCGHATIAAFEVLKSLNKVKNNAEYYINTKAGNLKVHRLENITFMEQAPPNYGADLSKEEISKLYHILNIPASSMDYNNYLTPSILSTGLFDIMLPVKDLQTLNSIKPNMKDLADFSKYKSVVGVHAFTIAKDNFTAHCRNFAPLYGIDEECATGTSNGALSYYLYDNGIVKEDEMLFYLQGEAMNNPSLVQAQVRLINNKPKVLVGGSCKIINEYRLI